MVLQGSFTWQQTAEHVVVEVPLKGTSVRGLDVYTSARYVKINYRPYLVNLDLFEDVDDRHAVQSVVDGTLKLVLEKKERGEWPDLLCKEHKDKSAMRKRRCQSMEEKQQSMQAEKERLQERKLEEEKMSTKRQMQVDEMERQRLEDLKAEEKREAEESVYQAFKELNEKAAQSSFKQEESTAIDSGSTPMKSIVKSGSSPKRQNRKVSFIDAPVTSSQASSPVVVDSKASVTVVKDEENLADQEEKGGEKQDPNAIFSENDLISSGTSSPSIVGTAESNASDQAAKGDDDLESVLPPPRAAARVKMTFTSRVFPTPMRESKREEEEDWLLRNRRHLKGKAREKLDSIDISERDPYWLKGKGDDFFKAKNLEGALNAYSCALEVDPAMTSCLSNRAACFLKLGQYKRCIEDCDQALENIKLEREEEIALATKEGFAEPPKELKRTRDMRKKLHVRKGTALSMMRNHVDALHEYQTAFEIDPFNEDLKADCARLTCLVQSDAQKDLGDSSFRTKEYERALKHYNKALEFNPDAVPVLLNRSACYLKMGDTRALVDDCKSALDIINEQVDDEAKPETNPAEQAEREQQEGLKRKLLLRLGSGYAQLGNNQDALSTFEQALEMDPTDISIAKQIKLLEKQSVC